MINPKHITEEPEKNDAESIIKWIDSLAKIVVVITALLYLIGRSYTESYYAHMGIPTNNLPLTIQEYIFMSTKSLSFLKSAASFSLTTVLIGILANVAEAIFSSSLKKYIKKNEKPKQGESNTLDKPNKNDNKTEHESNVGIEENETKNAPKAAKDTNKMLEYESKLRDWLKSKLIYIIPSFIVLFFIMLIPSAKASGKVDSEYAIQNASLGRVLLNQPSLPELNSHPYVMQNNEVLYDYGILPIVGILGDNYLLVLESQSGKKSILSVPVSQVVSINYVNYVSLTPMPTITATPIVNPTLSKTATP